MIPQVPHRTIRKMGRAPNPGAPQRVSAHVLPKAQAFSVDDEDEKTTIESGGWEEEASTTVEQGEVADKLRALGVGLDQARRPNTGITSTNGGASDEPTVDDQRVAGALAMVSPQIVARLVITQGNDSGKAIEGSVSFSNSWMASSVSRYAPSPKCA